MKRLAGLIACLLACLLALTGQGGAQVLPAQSTLSAGVSDGVAATPPLSLPVALFPLIVCDQSVRLTAGGAASSVLIAHVVGKTTYVCSVAIGIGQSASGSAQTAWGTGSACATATASSSPLASNGAAPTTGANLVWGMGLVIDSSPVAGTSDYCLLTVGSPVVNGSIRFAQL